MGDHKRFTNEEIIQAYKDAGSVWKAAKNLGACGQSVWERLNRLGYPMFHARWTEEEVEHLTVLAPQCTIGEIARRLGRTYPSVASQLSLRGLGVRFGNSGTRTVKRGHGLTKVSVKQHISKLASFGGSLMQFCRNQGLDIEVFVKGIQRYFPEFWESYTRSHSDIEIKICPQCSREFVPMSGKQRCCSRKCSNSLRIDQQYFGGKRVNTIGLAEGICQLCEKEKNRLSSHHILGKENDPENSYLVALCPGCHQLVTHAGARADVAHESFWENLISLSLFRKFGSKKRLGFHVIVDIHEMTEEDMVETEEGLVA